MKKNDLEKSRPNSGEPGEDWGDLRFSNLEESCRKSGLSVREISDQLLENMSMYIVKRQESR